MTALTDDYGLNHLSFLEIEGLLIYLTLELYSPTPDTASEELMHEILVVQKEYNLRKRAN